MIPEYDDTRRAFDGVASCYDGPFGNNSLIQRMRKIVLKEIVARIPPDSKILDLGCGTGIDAVHLAGLGHRILAIDDSANMVRKARERAAGHGALGRIAVKQLGIHELSRLSGICFDAVFSDFGALNCIPDIAGLAEDCARLLRPDGMMIVNVMGKYCPWETGYYLLHGHPRRAFSRWKNRFLTVPLGDGYVWTRYYHPAQWFDAFSRRFDLVGYRAVSLLVPPPYLESWATDHPALFRKLDYWDEKISHMRVFRNMGDHFLMTMRLK